MPSSMPHLIVAKKVNPNASVDFYVGNLSVDAIRDVDIKGKAHFENAPDMEIALKEFAVNANNDYLKGVLLHLYVDWKWKTVYLTNFANEIGQNWLPKYREEISKITAYAFHSISWALELYEQLEQWNYDGFIETEYIKEENVKDYIHTTKKWQMDNKLEPSLAFPPELIEKFANDTAEDFKKWFADLRS